MRVSVIIPAYRANRTLPSVLRALEPQVARDDREVVVVDSTTDGDSSIELQGRWLRVISVAQRMLPGEARNLGVSLASGELVAFLDADAIPESGWLDELERAMGADVEMVAGAVLDGTPDARWGTAGYMLEFLEWTPDRRTPIGHAAGCNLLVRRAAFERAGGFPEDLWPAEDTVFSFGFGLDGTLVFSPEARVTHLNRVARRDVLAHQRLLGGSWAEACARVPLPGGRLVVPRLAPVAVIGRVWSMVRQARRQPGGLRRLASHGPLLAARLVAWAIGVLHPVPSTDIG